MSIVPLVSIIITSFNYGRFLGEAIDSALSQTHPRTEVIVVDDGSTDNSRAVIASYGDRLIPVLKTNGGQASAFNAGFRVSQGEVVCFMDSDDSLHQRAIENAVAAFDDTRLVKVHWPLTAVDEHGREIGKFIPPRPLSEGDLRECVRQTGPEGYVWPPTTGNAWARSFLYHIFPMPEAEYTTCADFYLAALAPLFGPVKRLMDPQGVWRLHGHNNSWGETFDERLGVRVRQTDHCLDALGAYGQAMGISVDVDALKLHSASHRIQQATEEIAALVPAGATMILVDQDSWGAADDVAGRRRIPFLERDGRYWGRPADDATAIRELERLRHSGAQFIVFAWPHLWWLDHYSGLVRHLRSRYRRVLENDRIVVFDLRS
jgi:glycosyltransferase involved in cell wall biosynthesis